MSDSDSARAIRTLESTEAGTSQFAEAELREKSGTSLTVNTVSLAGLSRLTVVVACALVGEHITSKSLHAVENSARTQR